MMAGYLTGHVPDSLKHLLPDMQQYWSAAAHSEGTPHKLFRTVVLQTLRYFKDHSSNIWWYHL